MKETPLLFQGDMVRALLNNTKTQTRRVIKPQPIFEGVESFGDSWKWSKGKDSFSGVTHEQLVGPAGLLYGNRCPYQVGNRLWVKETFGKLLYDGSIVYRADGEREPKSHHLFGGKWRPSIFMPRSASRITLEITEVRVQRVQEISEEDAKAEGIQSFKMVESCGERLLFGVSQNQNEHGTTAKVGYEILWDLINAKRGYPWSANPWVWAITFKRI